MDFMSDQLFDDRRCLQPAVAAIDVRQSYSGSDVVETLERVTRVHGMPGTIRVDNGPEFISKALDLWAWITGVALDFSRQESRRTMPSSNRSTDRSGRSA